MPPSATINTTRTRNHRGALSGRSGSRLLEFGVVSIPILGLHLQELVTAFGPKLLFLSQRRRMSPETCPCEASLYGVGRVIWQ